MKNLLFTILFISFVIKNEKSNAQAYCLTPTTDPCCNGIISTGIPFAQNDERSILKNKFDWTTEYWKVYLPAASNYQGDIKNPFYSEDEYLSSINFATLIGIGDYPTKENLDFKPSDGWELVHKDDGYLADQITITPNNGFNAKKAPHVILYNKYRGLLRIISGMPAGVVTGTNQILFELSHNQNNNGLSPSGLFNKMQAPIQALDVQSDVLQFAKATTPSLEGSFVVADFLINYDPCICNSQNYFRVKFNTITNMQISLGGRLIGTNVPLDASGNAPLLSKRNDFLTSVATNGTNVVNGGALTYANIDKLAAQYKAAYEPNNSDPVTAFFFKTLKDGIVDGLASIGKSGNAELNKQASIFYETQFGGEEIMTIGSKVLSLPKKLNLGLTLASQGTKMLSGILFPEKEKPSNPVPLISFIEAEMVLSGNITGKAPINGATDILFAIPGSKHSIDPAKTPDAKYPAYNEPLGLFSLLETPKGVVRYQRTTKKILGGMNASTSNNPPNTDWGTESLTFQLNKNSIKYAFNPSAEIDLENTKIYASLELEETNKKTIFDKTYAHIKDVYGCPLTLDDPYSDFYSCKSLKGVDYEAYGEFVPNVLEGTGSTQKYSTSIMPIECLAGTSHSISFDNLLLKKLTTTTEYYYVLNACPKNVNWCQTVLPSYFNRDNKLVLKLHIDYVFKKNKFGKINRYFEILTYPINVTSGDITVSPANSALKELTLSGGKYPAWDERSVWNKITVNGILDFSEVQIDPEFNPEGNVYSVGTEIEFTPESEVFGPAVFYVGNQNLCGDKILPVSTDEIKSFCTSKYFAKNLVSFRQENDELFIENKRHFSNDAKLTTFPNPVTSSSTISYSISDISTVRLYISDLTGNTIKTLVDEQSHPEGSYQKMLNSESLASGTYICIIDVNGEKHVQRLVVMK